MEAPKCRICGERHWSRVCEPDARQISRDASRDEALRLARKSEASRDVVTPRQADLEQANKDLLAEVARLEDEVRQLKQELAERKDGDAERAKRYRERKKA